MGQTVQSAYDRLSAVVRSGLIGLASFTFVIDLLLLVQPLYMLQVYDRVLASSSIETLVFISIMAAGALLLLGFTDVVRSLLANRLAAKMDVEAGPAALRASLAGPRAALGDVQPLRDLGIVRGFVSNRGIIAYLDLPFAPLFIGLLYFIHPHLFWLTVAGAVILVLLAVRNQILSSRAATTGGEMAAMGAMLAAQSYARSAETINAMSMTANVNLAWGRQEALSLQMQERVGFINSVFSAISRVVRLGLQIAILGYGAYLVVEGQMTGGMIFASSLISGRGLQPVDQVIGGWKGFVETNKAWARLKLAIGQPVPARDATELPAPEGRLTLDNLVVFGPNATNGAEPILKRISAEFAAGQCVAIIGSSGAGKSVLARAIVGALQPRSGMVRIDGADIRTWRRDQLGRSIGYLAQDVDLLPGTVAENIARFDPSATDAAIVEAARKAQVHELILAFPNGYDTLLGPTGQQLSGGQRQRIGLARAFFGQPRLLVLDEPNSNLDSDGETALETALAQAREDKVTVLIVTQRRQIVAQADIIMVLHEGHIADIGPRLEVVTRQMSRGAGSKEPRSAGAQPPFHLATGRFASNVAG